MHRSFFFKLFPPPRYLAVSHSGLEIEDNAIRMVEYGRKSGGMCISKFDSQELPDGLVDGGDVRDENKFVEILTDFVRRNRISYARVSLPEEKVYLFQTDIESDITKEATQNIEFKLEENVPLSAEDSLFYFDILPKTVTGGMLRASVSVAPKTYIEKFVSRLKSVGVTPIALEISPKAITRSAVPLSDEPTLIIHAMKGKTGTYIVSGGVVCFSSTLAWTSGSNGTDDDLAGKLVKEIGRVRDYWSTRPETHSDISHILFVGENAVQALSGTKIALSVGNIKVAQANTWENIFDLEKYIPPIDNDRSSQFVVAAGLALPL